MISTSFLRTTPDVQPYFEHKSSIKQSARTVFRVDTLVGTKYNLYKDTQVICMFEVWFQVYKSCLVRFEIIVRCRILISRGIVTGFVP